MEPSASDGEAARPFSVLLRERRRAAGLTQEALAERAGLSPRTVRGLERGASRPYPDTVARLARALALPPAAAAALAAAPVPHNLPAPLTALVGRERELAEAGRCLADPAGPRLLTLTGPGGGGKTRLALALAARLVAAAGDAGAPGADGAPYPDGVWLAELAALADPSLVPQAVAAAVSVREVPGRPLTETLCQALRARRLLLVLDNCEHLLEACALLATALLRAGPGVRVLATSRRPLGLVGEATWSVPPLAWPAGPAGEALPPAALPAPAALLEYGAVRLFVERARDVWPAFALTAANAPAVVQVCARLDGLPLALELAARQVVVLPPAALAERLDARFRLLTGGPAGPPRQRTLRATLDWSHALLGEAERALFRRLAVFAGGWTLEAAEAVCADDPGGENEEAEEVGGAEVAGGTGGAAPRGHLAAEAVLEALRRLVDQSLVMAVHDPSAEATRYRLLETVRQYAAERLAEAGEGETVRARHAAWAVALAEQGARGALGAHREVWQERLEREQDNFRAALSWALSDPSGPERPDREDPTAPAGPAAGAGLVALQLSGALWRFWSTTGATAEGRVWLERALAATGSGTAGLPAPAGRSADVAALRARALLGAGALAGRRGDFRTARGYDERSLDLYRGLGDWHGIAEALHALAHLAEYRGDTAAVRSLFAESLAARGAAGIRRRWARRSSGWDATTTGAEATPPSPTPIWRRARSCCGRWATRGDWRSPSSSAGSSPPSRATPRRRPGCWRRVGSATRAPVTGRASPTPWAGSATSPCAGATARPPAAISNRPWPERGRRAASSPPGSVSWPSCTGPRGGLPPPGPAWRRACDCSRGWSTRRTPRAPSRRRRAS